MGTDTKQLEWINLLDGFCPKCDGNIEEGDQIVKCDTCEFKMGRARYDELIKTMEREQGRSNE